jgi:hypothetical protein
MDGLIGGMTAVPGERDALPAVREAIARGRPLIAGFDAHTVTTPVGGHGLPARPSAG